MPLLGETLEHLAAKIDPGMDGIALRNGQRWSHAFPAQQRVTNTGQQAEQTISALALEVGLALADVADFDARRDVSAYEFSTINLLQREPHSPPERIWRGERLVAQTEITREAVAAQANALVRHILARAWPEPPAGESRLPLGLMGDYHPVSDRFQPMSAPTFEQALCAWTLVEYGQSGFGDTELAKDALAAARQILRDLAEAAPGEPVASDDLAGCAAMLVVASAMPSCLGDAAVAELILNARKRLESAFVPGQGFQSQINGGQTQPVPAVTQSLIATAWVRMMDASVDLLRPPPAATIRAALDATWEATPAAQHVALLPWIALAEVGFAAEASQPLAHASELQRLLQMLREVRVPASRAAEAPGLIGGLQLTGQNELTGKPSAQSLRPAAWLAAALRVPELNPPEQHVQNWGAHLETMRFVRQLTVSDLRASTYRRPGRAVGGICASPWDSRQPLAAQAMGLLTMVETLRNWRN
jgi:hypothetical protein